MRRLVAVVGCALLALLFFAPAALAATPDYPHTGRVLISIKGDVSVPAGEQADVLVIIQGTAHVAGTVNSIVAVEATVDLQGAQVEGIVAVRSPVTVGPNTVVTNTVATLDSTVTQVGNGVIQGGTRDLSAEVAGFAVFIGAAAILFWAGFLLVALAAALTLAGLAARQVRTAESIISREPVKAFAAGLLGVILPLFVIVALFITIVGAPLALALLVGVWPLTVFAGYLISGIWIGEWLLRASQPAVPRQRPYLAALIGVIVLEILTLVPFAGAIATLFGYGAVILLAWRTLRGGAPVVPSVPYPAPVPLAS